MSIVTDFLHVIHGYPSFSPLVMRLGYTGDRLKEGSIVRMSSQSAWAVGVGTTLCVPFITLIDSQNSSVVLETSDLEEGGYANYGGAGNLPALALLGGVRVQTHQFVDAVYTTNQPLYSPSSGGDAGKVAAGTKGTHMIIGLATGPKGTFGKYGPILLDFIAFPIPPT